MRARRISPVPAKSEATAPPQRLIRSRKAWARRRDISNFTPPRGVRARPPVPDAFTSQEAAEAGKTADAAQRTGPLRPCNPLVSTSGFDRRANVRSPSRPGLETREWARLLTHSDRRGTFPGGANAHTPPIPSGLGFEAAERRPLVFPRPTNVYIDGFNLYHGCLKGTPFKWLDPRRFSVRLLPAECGLREIHYYTARVRALPHDPGAPTRQQMYRPFDSLDPCGAFSGSVEVHAPASLTYPAHRSWNSSVYSPSFRFVIATM